MAILFRCAFLFTIAIAAVGASEEPRAAVATIVPRAVGATQNILGTIIFTETDEGLRITGSVTGLPAGNYGFHVHERGDITTCDSSLAHFNPENTNHGAREAEVRHVGDLGNVQFVGTTVAVGTIDVVDKVLSLRGSNNIIGRTLVLHEREDDLGLGGHADSLTTGNAGARVACGVIGIFSPITPWNAGVTISPSLILFFAATLAVYLRV